MECIFFILLFVWFEKCNFRFFLFFFYSSFTFHSRLPRRQGSILYCTTGIILQWLRSDPWVWSPTPGFPHRIIWLPLLLSECLHPVCPAFVLLCFVPSETRPALLVKEQSLVWLCSLRPEKMKTHVYGGKHTPTIGQRCSLPSYYSSSVLFFINWYLVQQVISRLQLSDRKKKTYRK